MGIIELAIEFITPERAREYLSRKTRNRTLSSTKVRTIQEHITSGEFELTHQAIAFTRNGRLFDGQHRLEAVASGSCGAWFVVARYDDDAHARRAMMVLDRGRARGAGETAEIVGILDSGGKRHAAAATAVLRAKVNRAPDHLDVIARIKSDVNDVRAVSGLLGGSRLSSVAVGAFAFMRPLAPEKVDALVTVVCTGVGAGPTEAALMRAMLDRVEGNSSERRVQFLKFCRGIEAHIDGETLVKLQELRDAEGFIARIEARREKAGAQ